MSEVTERSNRIQNLSAQKLSFQELALQTLKVTTQIQNTQILRQKKQIQLQFEVFNHQLQDRLFQLEHQLNIEKENAIIWRIQSFQVLCRE